jgi:hypothetical protein
MPLISVLQVFAQSNLHHLFSSSGTYSLSALSGHTTAMSPLSASSLECIFNHLILPPRLPGKRDSETEEIESHLTTLLLGATGVLRDISSGESAEAWSCIQRSLDICNIVNEDNRLNKTSLLDAFGWLQHKDGLILQIAEQNAGLLIRRHFK